jgi:hypothetical protein
LDKKREREKRKKGRKEENRSKSGWTLPLPKNMSKIYFLIIIMNDYDNALYGPN